MTQIDQADFDRKLNAAMHIIGIDFVEKLKNKLTKEHGKDTGKLQSSIQYKVSGKELTVNMDEHGRYVEYGTPPHTAPVDELKGWARRKLGDENLAWAVVKAIEKRGTQPYPFIRTTIKQDFKKIVREAFIEAFK